MADEQSVDDHDGARRPSLLAVVGTLALCGVFVGLLGRPILDALDQEQPYRDEVRGAATPDVELPLEAPDGFDTQEVRDALRSLPAGWIRLARRENLRFEIVRKEALGQVDFLHVEQGHYIHGSKLAQVAGHGPQPGKTALHEFGHFVDLTQGLTRGSRVREVRLACNHRYLQKAYFADDDREYFAESFALWYFSDRSRERQQAACPEMAAYLRQLEAEAR